MRHAASLMALILLGAGLSSGCTLSIRADDDPPPAMTATISATLAADANVRALETPVSTLPAPPTATVTLTLAPPPSATLAPSPTATLTPPPTFTPPPTAIPPTRTRPSPPTVAPLDDGSGRLVPGTGSDTTGISPVTGVDALPETLYYLSDVGGMSQVFRLRIGVNYPDQLTFSPTGVLSFDVAPDGRLAYITPDGQMMIDGVPFLPPAAPDGTLSLATSLAWSPDGSWLAFTLMTPGAADALGGAHPVDGLWIRSAQGSTVLIQPNIYSADDTWRTLIGPLEWHPGGAEILLGYSQADGPAFARMNISTGEFNAVRGGLIPPDSYRVEHWAPNGNIIALGQSQIREINPATLQSTLLFDLSSGAWQIDDAQMLADGRVVVFGGANGSKQLLDLTFGPNPLTPALTEQGKADFAWDSLGQQVVIAITDSGDTAPGTAYLRDQGGALHNITLLTGPVGSPKWGPAFKPGDAARVRTTEGDTLNVRATPGGDMLIQLVDGSRVTVTGGPRLQGGYQWWRIQTPDGIAGWAVESVVDDRGLRLRTLLPTD